MIEKAIAPHIAALSPLTGECNERGRTFQEILP
jgi:hypothetical protein